MNRIPATVHGVDGDTALVETENGGGCGRCNEPGGCRSGLIAGMFAPGPRTYRIANTIRAQAGQRVLVCLPDGAVLRSAIAGYLVPVLGVVLGAVLGHAAAGTDPATALGAVTGLGLGLLSNLWWRRRDRRNMAAPHLEPWNGEGNCGREHP
jgi:sigma-E factor negative regulatory protein RseC